jgi:hypothetical protein
MAVHGAVVLAVRRQCDRQVETDRTPAGHRVGFDLPADRDLAAEEVPGEGEVARADRRPDVRAPDGPPIEIERRHDDDLETASPRAVIASGVPRRSCPKAASGVMRNPASAVRDMIRSTKTSYGVRRRASSKCWTTVTWTPAAPSRTIRSWGSSRSAGAVPVRISSGWWSNVTTVGTADRDALSRMRWSSRYR